MQKIITFLGKYSKRMSYSYKGKIYYGEVFPEALREFSDYDQMLVFATDEARTKTYSVLERLEDPRIRLVPIPVGKNTDEMWKLFDIILSHIDEGDQVIFDITHGLRSIQFLMFLFAAFLKFARRVEIVSVFYGAFELGNSEENIPAPVFDLSEFVLMLDWLSATDRFIATGDGSMLMELLKGNMPPGLVMRDDLNKREIGKALEQMGDGIGEISQALGMVRPFEVMKSGNKILQTANTSEEIISETAQPFEALAEKIKNAYGQFALANPLDIEEAQRTLALQFLLIQWYLEHQQAAQAALLMREWLVSLLMVNSEKYPLNNLNSRIECEKILHNACRQLRDNGIEDLRQFNADISRLPKPEKILNVWDKLTQLRNDIAHCGMRENARLPEKLIDDTKAIYAELSLAREEISV